MARGQGYHALSRTAGAADVLGSLLWGLSLFEEMEDFVFQGRSLFVNPSRSRLCRPLPGLSVEEWGVSAAAFFFHVCSRRFWDRTTAVNGRWLAIRR